MKFEIEFSIRAMRVLEKRDKPVQIEILKKIKQLEQNSEFGKPLSNKLKGSYRLRVRKFRLIYAVEGSVILITKVGHRKDVYE